MQDLELQASIIRKKDVPISPISSAKTSYMDNGETVYNSINNMNTKIKNTIIVELINDENTDVSLDNSSIEEKINELESKINELQSNISNNMISIEYNSNLPDNITITI